MGAQVQVVELLIAQPTQVLASRLLLRFPMARPEPGVNVPFPVCTLHGFHNPLFGLPPAQEAHLSSRRPSSWSRMMIDIVAWVTFGRITTKRRCIYCKSKHHEALLSIRSASKNSPSYANTLCAQQGRKDIPFPGLLLAPLRNSYTCSKVPYPGSCPKKISRRRRCGRPPC